MSAQPSGSTCHSNCLIAGIVVGLLVFLFLMFGGDWSFVMSLIVGIAVAVLGTIVLRMVLCTNSGAEAVAPSAPPAPAPAAPRAAEPEPAPEPAPAPQPVAESTPEPAPAAEAAPEAAPEPEPADAPSPAASAPAEQAEAAQPAGIEAARDGEADDLKKIKGVGPKLEQLLHSLGIYHFDQIASWGTSEVAWMDDNLQGFRGRVTRDNWVEQAGLLAAGGETDFSRKVDEGDVY